MKREGWKMLRRYQIKYTNNSGAEIKSVSIRNSAKSAFWQYANRIVFGGNTIFCNSKLKMYDAETRGNNWAIFIADNKIVEITELLRRAN
jgi:hypothetical protein